MKSLDVFCASQASTAICLSMDHAPSNSISSSSSAIQLGGRAIDRHNPIISDSRRSFTRTLSNPPCLSQSPINPKPYHQLPNSSKKVIITTSSSNPKVQKTKTKQKNYPNKNTFSAKTTDIIKKNSFFPTDIVRRSCSKPDFLVTPPGSSRYLLTDTSFVDGLSDLHPVLSLVPSEINKTTTLVANQDDTTSSKSSSSNQVVVLRVSLHCKGCEGKVRKHISRMEGVTSFNIDFAAKKVTIMGDITPMNVLESVSKVKSAQFWTSSAPTSSVFPSISSCNKQFL